MMRSHYCTDVDQSMLNKTVTVCGWVHRRRDHGGVIFVDLRDRSGLLQVVFNPDKGDIFQQAERLRSEFVIQATGSIVQRPEGMVNPELSTGTIEVVADDLTILNAADTPPFPLDEYHPVHENVRLKYRYMDLRRPEMHRMLALKSKLTHHIRHFLDEHDFLDIETPILTKATPEGARDYLVPSRTHQGEFFALPQSPQLFKQLLMMSGMERYYQIARCFRDEDLRADRQPEFTQLDVEMSFVDEEDIQSLMEALVRYVFRSVIDVELPEFTRMSYQQAISVYGTDKPDLRIPLQLTDITHLVKDCGFQVFAKAAQSEEGRVAALRLPNGCAHLTRKQLDDYADFVGQYGAKGLAYIKINDKELGRDGMQSPILKFLDDELVDVVLQQTQAQTGDIIFFGADHHKIVNASLSALRTQLAQDLDLYEAQWAPLWVVDFPMFEYEDGHWHPLHHPFTSPQGDLETLNNDPYHSLSRAYDMVLNGHEIGGGSIRINDVNLQRRVFDILGISQQQADEKFGFLLDALRYGCPPHGGIAFGLDRIAMLMSGGQSIRDVIAFPKTQSASCLLTSAPSTVNAEQLTELNISLLQSKQ